MRTIFCLLFCVAAYSSSFAEYQLFYENGKAGLRDESGKVILPAAFDALGWADGSFSVINQVTGFRQKGKWGLINLKKEFITRAEYESVTSSGGDRVVASRQINPYTTKFGCIDLAGKVTVPFMYDGISIHGLRAIVFIKNGTKYEHGLVDLNDKSILPVKFRDIRPIGSLRFAIQNFDKHTALYTENGIQLTDFVIDSISAFKQGTAIIYQDFKQGLIDREGLIQIQPVYRELRITDQGVEGRTNDTWNIIDSENKERISIDADELLADGSHYLISLSGKYGVVAEDLSKKIDLQYDYLNRFTNNLSVAKKDDRYGVISISNKVVIPFEYDSLVLEGNFVRAKSKNRWMLYDTFNVKKAERSYDLLLPYSGRVFPAASRNFWGAIDRYGKEVLTCVYDSLIDLGYEAANVKFKGLYGIIGYDEKWKVYPQKNKLKLIDDEHYIERQDSILFLKKFSGEIVYFTTGNLKLKDGALEETSADGAVRTVTLAGVSSTVVGPTKVDNTEIVFEESEGLRGIRRNGQYGFVDARGRLRIANRYQNIGRFHEGVAPVMILGKWGFVNHEDRIVVNPAFDGPTEFNNGIAIVRRNGKTGVIDKTGQLLLPLRYDSIKRVGKLLVIHQQNQFGVADYKGNVLIEPHFDHLELLPNNLVIIRDREKWGVLTVEGMPVIPLVYSFIKYNPATNQFLANRKSDWKVLSKS